MKKLIALLTVFTFAFTLAACDADEPENGENGENGNGEETQTVNLDYVNWAEGIAMNYLAEAILIDEMGYDVNSTEGDPGVVFTSIAQGDADFFIDAWLPLTHGSYMEQYGDEILDLGFNFEEAPIGLVVPSYVTIDSIDELNEHADKFNDEIVGIDPGAGLMSSTETVVEDYNLTLNLSASSGPVMVQELANAIDNEEWIVVTGWEPHYKFADFDLKFLEDPQGIYGEPDNIHTVARPGAREDLPEVVEFFENFYLTSEELGGLMGLINENQGDMDVVDIARMWMEDNEDVWQSWIPAE